ncbi:hypothetical protein JUJ52_03685 [Virgibacillus sp. AGTR]|uniref:hypothetical protein n=1 Tax=Virgibacillus sp. AGTR TaxID=2812055 RepID=UPI001D16858D|nr:hypothetical protein [Virgibacillus sp. AGTR]MCC2249060.1 hypothetical protein [Virgibacillus sp. AGTR]
MKKLLVFVILAFTLMGCSEESKAKNTAEEYMDSVKNGDEFEEIIAEEEFIDVFDYEYLKTIDEYEEKEIKTLKFSIWESVYGEESDPLYPTFEEYKKSYIEPMEAAGKDYEIIKDNGEVLEYWDGETYKKVYELLYNVEIANELGEKIYKKAEITVEESVVEDGDDLKEGFIISDINLRD